MNTQKTICVDCLLFTLNGKSVHENKYIPIFYYWLSLFNKNSGLTINDYLNIKMDTFTFEHIKNDFLFISITQNLKCSYNILLFNPPNSLLEGMMMKYRKINYNQDVYMYCDIDVLVIKSLKTFDVSDDAIYTHPEGSITDDNYGAAFTKDELSFLSNSPGYSAGKFLISCKNLYNDLMNIIHEMYISNKTAFYTIEQPLFNKALFCMNKYKINNIPINTICINGNNFTTDTILLDCMGIPGDGDFHFDKIYKFYIMIMSNLL
jgi:hypothetical protein